MSVIKIEGFSGIAPRSGPTLLETNQAQVASNIKLQSGELRPWRKETFVLDAGVPNTKTIYQLEGAAGQTGWLTWDKDVDIVTSPVADTSDFRFYYTGDGAPKKSNWAMASPSGTAPLAYYDMGLPAPTGPALLSATGGTSTQETRAYVYTVVSKFGALEEESAPSPAALVTCSASGATVTLTGFAALPAGNLNIIKRRIYRSVTGATSTVYLQVAEIPVSTGTYLDTVAVTALGGPLKSLNYTPPPSTLTGLVSMPNGILAGFTGTEVWFSEPSLPHAWPADYVLTTEFPIVGLGVFGSSLVVMTTKNPYVITGSHPAVMSQEKLSLTHACISKRSIAFDQHGVLYASPYGLVNIGPGVQDVITTGVMTADDWQEYNPSTMTAILFGSFYMGFYTRDGEYNAVVLARNGDTPPVSTFSYPVAAVYLQRATGRLFACNAVDNAVYQLDASTLNNTQYTWKSRVFNAPMPVNFSVMQLNADFSYLNDQRASAQAYDEYIASVADIFASAQTTGVLGGEINAFMANVLTANGSTMPDAPPAPEARFVRITVYADGAPVTTKYLRDQSPMRLPAGFKAYDWEVEIHGNVPVRMFAMATSMMELKQV